MQNNPLTPQGTIVDVRTSEEFIQGHFPGAINIPLNKVPECVSEFKEMKKPVLLYCRSGNRSGMAASLLHQNGVMDVYNAGSLEDLLKQMPS